MPPPAELPLTGERTVPGIAEENYWFRRHEVVYRALGIFESRWRHGGSPVLRGLADAGAVELLGGPATHPFAPLLRPEVAAFALEVGLADAALRTGARPSGIWAPECGYAPGMEHGYAVAGVRRFAVDGPALRGDTGLARPVSDSDVLCFGRDLEVTYRVWSPRAGYPGTATTVTSTPTTIPPGSSPPAPPAGRCRPSAAPLRPCPGRRGGRAGRGGLRRRGARPPARPAGAAGAPRADRGRVRHRAVRALVVRGAGLAGGGATGAAGSGGGGDELFPETCNNALFHAILCV